MCSMSVSEIGQISHRVRNLIWNDACNQTACGRGGQNDLVLWPSMVRQVPGTEDELTDVPAVVLSVAKGLS